MNYAKILAVFGVLALLGAGSATLLDVYGSIRGTVSVERPVEISEINYNSPIGGEESGEYVVLEINRDSMDLSEWNLTTSDSSEDRINASRSVERQYVALVDNTSTVSNTSSELESADVELVETGNLGLTNADGNEGSGENVTLRHMPSENVMMHEVDYSLSSCEGMDAFKVSTGNCGEPLLEIDGGGN
jgi:hypothetical protein